MCWGNSAEGRGIGMDEAMGEWWEWEGTEGTQLVILQIAFCWHPLRMALGEENWKNSSIPRLIHSQFIFGQFFRCPTKTIHPLLCVAFGTHEKHWGNGQNWPIMGAIEFWEQPDSSGQLPR